MSPPRPVEFAFVDTARRTWLALNREGDGYHVVSPIPADAQLIIDGLRKLGDLGCSCAGGRFRGTCYVTKAAEALELVLLLGPAPEETLRERVERETAEAIGDHRDEVRMDDVENWFDGPPGEVMEAWGK